MFNLYSLTQPLFGGRKPFILFDNFGMFPPYSDGILQVEGVRQAFPPPPNRVERNFDSGGDPRGTEATAELFNGALDLFVGHQTIVFPVTFPSFDVLFPPIIFVEIPIAKFPSLLIPTTVDTITFLAVSPGFALVPSALVDMKLGKRPCLLLAEKTRTPLPRLAFRSPPSLPKSWFSETNYLWR